MPRTVLVTGAAGFIGFHTALRLLRRGDHVIGFDNLNDYYDVTLKEARLRELEAHDAFTGVRADVVDAEAIADVFRSFDDALVVPDGRVIYGLKRPWRDGTSAISFDPLTFIERLAALVPPPRAHQLTYHGVLALASAWRDLIVPRHTTAPAAHSHGTRAPNSPTAPSSCARSRSSRSSWAELLRRVFAIDVLTCPHCGGPRRLIAQLTDPHRRAQDPRPPRTAHRASTVRAGALARTVRLRLRWRPSPRRARSSPATRAGE